jgi:diguanylate cyclase (GGDEF)-like protein
MRHRMPISMALFDIDNFQAYLDNAGRAAAEDKLRQIARMFKGTLQRWADTAARYGNARFVAIMPQTDEDGARRVAERVTEAMAGLKLPHGFNGDSAVFTVRVGWASCVPAVGQDPVSLMRMADAHVSTDRMDGQGAG